MDILIAFGMSVCFQIRNEEKLFIFQVYTFSRMLLYLKEPSLQLFPKHLALVGQIHEPPINWQLRHWETLTDQYAVELSSAKGYALDDYIDESLLNEAQRKAQAADLAILCVSTTADRLSQPQHQLIRSVTLVQPNVWVAVWSATPFTMPWASKVNAILHVPNICTEQDFFATLQQHTL
jgi:hypothetical protein